MKPIRTLLQCVAILCLLLASTYSHAQSITIASEDSPLNVNGYWNDADMNTITRSIRVTSTQGGNIELLAYDLKMKDNPNRMISRSDISIEPVSLSPNKPQNINITFANIPLDGTYEGNIQLFIGNGQPTNLAVTVVAERFEPERIMAISTSDSLQVNVVGGWGFNWLLPPGTRAKKFSVTLENKSDIPTQVKSYSFFARGGKVGTELDNGYFTMEEALPLEIPANGRSTVHFKINKTNMIPGVGFLKRQMTIAPDGYSGNLQFQFADGSEAKPIYIDLKMNARSGLGLVIIALLLGIILGKIIKDMSSKKAEAQIALMGTLVALKPKIEEIAKENDGDDFGLLGEYKRLENSLNDVTGDDQSQFQSSIEAFTNKIKKFNQLMVKIGGIKGNSAYQADEKAAHVNTLKSLGGNMAQGITPDDQMEEQVNMLFDLWKHTRRLHTIESEADADDLQFKEDIGGVMSKIKLVENDILSGKPAAEVQKSIEGIEEEIKVTVLHEEPTSKGVTRNAEDNEPTTNNENVDIPQLPTTQREPTGIMKGIQWVWKTLWFVLIDAKEPDARTRYWFFRPLLTFIILAWAVLAGINDAYLGNSTFGAEGFNDYLDLILYGIGSKITASTIGDLGDKAATRVG